MANSAEAGGGISPSRASAASGVWQSPVRYLAARSRQYAREGGRGASKFLGGEHEKSFRLARRKSFRHFAKPADNDRIYGAVEKAGILDCGLHDDEVTGGRECQMDAHERASVLVLRQ